MAPLILIHRFCHHDPYFVTHKFKFDEKGYFLASSVKISINSKKKTFSVKNLLSICRFVDLSNTGLVFTPTPAILIFPVKRIFVTGINCHLKAEVTASHLYCQREDFPTFVLPPQQMHFLTCRNVMTAAASSPENCNLMRGKSGYLTSAILVLIWG